MRGFFSSPGNPQHLLIPLIPTPLFWMPVVSRRYRARPAVGFCAIGEIRVISVVFDSNRPDHTSVYEGHSERSESTGSGVPEGTRRHAVDLAPIGSARAGALLTKQLGMHTTLSIPFVPQANPTGGLHALSSTAL